MEVMYKLKDKIETLYHNIIYGIQNLFRYFSVIWNDRDWDHYWIYVILRKKLQSMSQSFEKYNRYVGVEKDVKKMRFCIKCLNRLIEDDYFDPKNKLEEKWGKFNLEIFNENNKINIPYQREKVIIREDEELYYDDLKKYWDMENFNKRRDLRLLFKVLELNIENWWD